MSRQSEAAPEGLIARLVAPFLRPQPPVLFMILALSLGLAALFLTPREEEPQIVVPLADVFVQAPGASAREVEQLVATPLEKLLWQIDGVEYVYSMSRDGQALVTVRFHVGEDRERSLVKLHNKISMNIDQAPPIVTGWVIRPVEIDDVPIVNLTLYSRHYNDFELRRIGQEALAHLTEVEDISRSELVGGRDRELRVELDVSRLAARSVAPLQVLESLRAADAAVQAGSFDLVDQRIGVTGSAFLQSAREVEELVVGVHAGRPVYLRDVARVLDGPEESWNYSRIGFSALFLEDNPDHPAAVLAPDEISPAAALGAFPAVTLALAKKKGSNAVDVAAAILERLEELKGTVIPDDVVVEVTRNYGQTAQQKVNELLTSLFFAVATVVVLLGMTLGRREALIVAVAVPVSFSLALFVNYLFGFTINRVTLFALILSLGLVVDDPITNVDNIQRHILGRRRKPREATLFAIGEVLPPVLLSTLAIIISFTPMFFITGMMGPYMAPMAANVPLTVIFSTLASLTLVPWLAYTLLRRRVENAAGTQAEGEDVVPGWVRRGYERMVSPFLGARVWRWALVGGILLLLGVALALPLLRLVPLKMLPFDNKNELQLVLDLPEGSTLEATDRVVRDFEAYLRGVPEVTNFVSYVGSPSPMDFNGLVRHYYLRQEPHLADIRINLADKDKRRMQSHALALRLRSDLEELAQRHGAALKIVETPPGPPVLATVVAEIYGAPGVEYVQLMSAAQQVRRLMEDESFVVDVDTIIETPRARLDFTPDKEKSALHGISTAALTQTLALAVGGFAPATLHLDGERQPLFINVILPREQRSGAEALGQLSLVGAAGKPVPLVELGRFEKVSEAQTIYHKNLRPVVYVTAEMAGQAPGEAILDMQKRLRDEPLPAGVEVQWAGEGEWEITLRVFRDLGLAFGAAMVGVYILLALQTGSFFLPLLILLAVPLTVIGIMPGFWLLNLLLDRPVGGFADPVFFTATGMIGMIALGGIVIRNAVVLIDFIRGSLNEGLALREAILESGATRLRPIVLTAMTTALGAWPITLDPIFSGLAWALIFGLFSSTLFTLIVVPVAFYAVYRKRYEG
ncbi:Multidrug efflux pump subunit AcrB [Geoalkalibacter ferrihydriticus]|uniref:Acriflavine resistance protein B n=2 Tax=Geoalkalibacter ferrihydriticus TaxID=392333 RepID=A0A0C2HML1_9BACT|nr:efflux RND transporter permease subunit [Geoalkalibacter ferrihydriticus]KIH76155.1 acriflavine resistance protein B [Geoalkalibacter ferrihydriticus DSM 17813]SDM42204.1 Multidrug efflux pump subunit AcrB [Geoalkalibacter ferrihydriticus]